MHSRPVFIFLFECKKNKNKNQQNKKNTALLLDTYEVMEIEKQ